MVRRWMLCAGGAAMLAGLALTVSASPWSDAIRRGDLETLHALAGTGLDVDARGHRGKTALMLAASRNDVALLGRLLALGAHPDRRNDAGGTALMYAAQYGHETAARTLLDAGAGVDLVAAKGWTALMVAVLKDHRSVVALLIARGADPDVADMHGWSPLMRALEAGHLALARDLVESARARVDVAAASGLTALHLAALRGQVDVTRLLLDRGADAAARDGEGNTPLAVAEREGHAEVAALLRAALAAR